MKRVLVAAVAVLLVLAGSASAADFGDGANKRFQFELGGAWSSFDTEASLTVKGQGGQVSGGAVLDFEKILNIPVTDTHFKGSGQWRFSNVSYVQVGFESIAREGQRVLDEDVTWGDVTYSADAMIDGRFDTDEFYLGYRWDGFKADNVKVGFTIGFSYLMVKGALNGSGTLTKPDGTHQSGSFERGFDLKAPVPVIGIAMEGAISSKVTFGFGFRALYISTSEFGGGIIQAGAKVKWYVIPNFGVGGGLEVSSIRINKYVDGNENYTARYNYAGPVLFLVAAF